MFILLIYTKFDSRIRPTISKQLISLRLSVPRFVSEGYLGLEWSEHEAGLENLQRSIVTRTDLGGLRDKRLMLVHGMRDARVSLENTVALSERLVQQSIMFQQKVCEVFF